MQDQQKEIVTQIRGRVINKAVNKALELLQKEILKN